MAKYDDEALLELCNKIDLLDYAMTTMEFRSRGTDSYACSCPRHIDETPSLLITPSKNLFHCMSCGVGGNIINWLMIFEHLTFEQAIDKIQKLAGCEISELKQCDALAFYKSIKKALYGPVYAEEKLQRTILDVSEIEKYRDEMPQEWIDEGILPEVMRKFDIRIDDRSNRIVYPVYDKDLNLIGFKGRTRFKNYKIMNLKKYQNYQKIGTVDYFMGMRENRLSILAKRKVIIFEGLKSVMKVAGWGYDYCLASESSWLNDDQIKILIQMQVKEVIIAFDSDVDITKIRECTKKLKKFTNVYAVIDKYGKILGTKEDKFSPCDKGREVWEQLLEMKVRV